MERWRPVAGFPGYEVSDFGRVRSAQTGKQVSRFLRNGYPSVILVAEGKKKWLYVHRLVAMAFVAGRTDEKWQVNHLNGKRFDPRAVNLEWTTPQGNTVHASRTGLFGPRHHERNGNSRLTRKQVDEIWALILNGDSYASIGRKYGVSDTTVSAIHKGRLWPGTGPTNPFSRIRKRRPAGLGESASNRKLTEDCVREIRRLREEGWTYRRLSAMFGTRIQNIASICKRQTWKHID